MNVAIGAVQIRRVAPGRGSIGGMVVIADMHTHFALSDFQGSLERFDHADTLRAAYTYAVLNDLERLLILSVYACIALRCQQLFHFLFRKILRYGNAERDDEARVTGRLRPRRERGVNRIRRIAAYALPAAAAIKLRGARKEELQVIIELRHSANGRARGTDGIRLVDGDCGRNAVNRIDLRLVHAIEKLARIRRECLDITPLAFRIQRIEDERRLA